MKEYIDNIDACPANVKEILFSFNEETDNSYTECNRIISELNKIGWNADYDLSGQFYTLYKLTDPPTDDVTDSSTDDLTDDLTDPPTDFIDDWLLNISTDDLEDWRGQSLMEKGFPIPTDSFSDLCNDIQKKYPPREESDLDAFYIDHEALMEGLENDLADMEDLEENTLSSGSPFLDKLMQGGLEAEELNIFVTPPRSKNPLGHLAHMAYLKSLDEEE